MARRKNKTRLRWQLYRQALPLGLTPRRGGYSVEFLEEFLSVPPIPPPPTPLDILFNVDASIFDWIEALDFMEANRNQKILIEARQFYKGVAPFSQREGRITVLKKVINLLETTEKSKKRGGKNFKTWKEYKMYQKEIGGLTQKEWRAHRNEQQNKRRLKT